MTLIVDPDNLNQGTEVAFNTTSKTITLSEAGNLTSSGCERLKRYILSVKKNGKMMQL